MKYVSNDIVQEAVRLVRVESNDMGFSFVERVAMQSLRLKQEGWSLRPDVDHLGRIVADDVCRETSVPMPQGLWDSIARAAANAIQADRDNSARRDR